MSVEEDLYHFLLVCSTFKEIRDPFMKELQTRNNDIRNHYDNHKIMTIAILDPESNFLPDNIRLGWTNLEETYQQARDYVFNIFKKRDKLTKNLDKQE